MPGPSTCAHEAALPDALGCDTACLPGRVTARVASAVESNALLAQHVQQALTEAVRLRGRAVLAVSGGQSPRPLFDALADCVLPWSHVTITLVDERCVPETHPASNARLVREHLLRGQAAQARFISMVGPGFPPIPDLESMASGADTALRALGAADLAILGMGVDGHTASIFPEAENVSALLDPQGARWCLPVPLDSPPAAAPYSRLSQTVAALRRARQLLLPVSGDEKMATLRACLKAPSALRPVSHLLHQTDTPVLLWITR